MTLHVVSLPHTQTTREYRPCAYTQKVIKFCDMMASLGYEINLYSSDQNEAPCNNQYACITQSEQQKLLGENNWKQNFFKLDWDASIPYWKIMNDRAIDYIKQTIKDQDIICLIGGNCQKPIADSFPNHMVVEFGVGYEGIFAKYRVFESYAWMHHVYGINGIKQGNYYDAVIPNYFDPNDFFVSEKEDYFLFVGRLISSKGIHAAVDTCKALNARLLVAGQGVIKAHKGYLETSEFKIEYPKLEYVGVIDANQRAYFMSKAKALFCPTQYIGPFEGVHIEAMLSGTPVITTDWGVFCETVINGFNGYRTRSLKEMIKAAIYCESLKSKLIRENAIDRYSLSVVRHRYDDYFKHLLTLWVDGWYST